jgi:hypothetical protein
MSLLKGIKKMASPSEGITNIAKDYQSANNAYALVAADYKTELLGLLDAIKSGKMSADHALWMFQLRCMPDATQGCEYQMQSESDALLAANAIRNQITQAQNDYNSALALAEGPNRAGHTASACQAAKNMYSALGAVSNLIHNFNLTKMMGASAVADIQGYIKNISNNINPNPNHAPRNHTGSRIYNYLVTLINQATVNGQAVPPQFNLITSNFNNLNQSVSGVSSYIQTQMNYLNQNMQQYLSVYNNFFTDFNTLNAYIVSKSSSS